LINHNQVFFSHLSVIGQFIASDYLWLIVEWSSFLHSVSRIIRIFL